MLQTQKKPHSKLKISCKSWLCWAVVPNHCYGNHKCSLSNLEELPKNEWVLNILFFKLNCALKAAHLFLFFARFSPLWKRLGNTAVDCIFDKPFKITKNPAQNMKLWQGKSKVFVKIQKKVFKLFFVFESQKRKRTLVALYICSYKGKILVWPAIEFRHFSRNF